MKIELTYDSPSQIKTDLLVIIIDKETSLYDLSGSPLNDTVRRIARDFEEKRLKKEYFTALDGRGPAGPAGNLLVFSTSLSTAFNIWEKLQT